MSLTGTIFLAIGLFLIYLGLANFGLTPLGTYNGYNLAMAPNWMCELVGGVIAIVGATMFMGKKETKTK